MGRLSIGWAWWRSRTTAERLDLPTRWSLLLFSASEPLVMLLIIGARKQLSAPGSTLILILSAGHAAACVLLLRAGFGHVTGAERPRPQVIAAAAALTAAGVAAGAVLPALVPSSGAPTDGYPFLVDVVTLFGAAFSVALTPMLRTPALIAVVTIPAAGLAALQSGNPGGEGELPWGGTYVFLVGVAVASYRMSVWSLGLIWEIDQSREIHSRLAVAEERLRFARDLHDVLGRNLSLIAVKSELAAQLARRGERGAVDQMLEVRQVAQESMREVREVVGGYRDSDLDTELAGARAVLASAGVAARVIGDGPDLPRAVQAALGWVVREATTNIIRHSAATVATIELDLRRTPAPSGVALRIENNGVRDADPAPDDGHGDGRGRRTGAGLIGLRERLVRLGGELSAETLPGGRFAVRAVLPLDEPPLPDGPLATAPAAGASITSAPAAGAPVPSATRAPAAEPGA